MQQGVCHGDLHYENIFFDAKNNKVTLFDFDFCGHGFLAYDLGCFLRYERNSPDNRSSFLEGYGKVRQLSRTEREALPYFEILMRLFHLGERGLNADGIKNPKWRDGDIENTIDDIEQQLSRTMEGT